MPAGDYFDSVISGNYEVFYTSEPLEPLETFEKSFGQMITYMLGSDLSQDIKDEYINKCLPLKNFRKYVKEYFPKYENKIKLWETLHGITPNS